MLWLVTFGYQNCRPAAVALVLGRYYRSTAAGAGCWGSTAAVRHLGPAAVAVLLQYKEGGVLLWWLFLCTTVF